MNELISILSFILNLIAFIYIVFIIPKRVKENGKNISVAQKNQTIIEKKIKEAIKFFDK